jgi:hypothetical protein
MVFFRLTVVSNGGIFGLTMLGGDHRSASPHFRGCIVSVALIRFHPLTWKQPVDESESMLPGHRCQEFFVVVA